MGSLGFCDESGHASVQVSSKPHKNRGTSEAGQGISDVASLRGQSARFFGYVALAILLAALPLRAVAAPYAAFVMDARTGKTLYSENADTRLHPASLTKMVTLYIVFDAIQRGEISLDTMVTVSRNAASKPPSRLGLKTGQKIALRYLIRAAAVKSANDAASAIGDYLSGSEPAFAERMNRTARALGMKNSTFKTANGLTAAGHRSTAHDMTIAGRRLFYDFPQYYNIFSRRSADAGIAQVNNTNRKFLDAYKGADGIKTGYTGPAGFNLTASAERGNVRIIATVFGGTSTAQRNAKMAKLLDLGFRTAPRNATTVRPGPVVMPADVDMVVASVSAAQSPDEGEEEEGDGAGGPSLGTSPRPRARPDGSVGIAVAVDAMQDGIAGALAAAAPAPIPFEVVEASTTGNVIRRPARAEREPTLAPEPIPTEAEPQIAALASASTSFRAPLPRTAEAPAAPVVVTRLSTSGGRHWGVNLGHYSARATAERVLMQTMLSESATLGDGLRKVAQRSGGYDANFMGLTRDQADMACRRLQARAVQCFTIGP